MKPHFRPQFSASFTLPSSSRAWLLGLAGFVAAPLSSVNAATLPWSDNGIVWGGPLQTTSGYYRPGDHVSDPNVYDDIPTSAFPIWTRGNNGGTESLNASGGYLNITTDTGQARDYRSDFNWDASSAATIEFTLRLNSTASGANAVAGITLGNANEWTGLRFGIHAASGDLAINGIRQTGVDARVFNTFRITLSDMESPATSVLRLYLNDDTSEVFSLEAFSSGTTFNRIFWGDTSTSAAGMSGSSDWGSVKWLSGVAVAPIPEPSALALFAGVGLLFAAGKMRKGKAGSEEL